MNLPRRVHSVRSDAPVYFYSFLMEGQPATILFSNQKDRFETHGPFKAEQVERGLYYHFLADSPSTVRLQIFLLDDFALYSEVDQVCLTFADGTGIGAFMDDEDKRVRNFALFAFSLDHGKFENEIEVALYDPRGDWLYSFSVEYSSDKQMNDA